MQLVRSPVEVEHDNLPRRPREHGAVEGLAVSPDSRFVAFGSASTNLTPQSAGGDVRDDLYVRDLQTFTNSRNRLGTHGLTPFLPEMVSPTSRARNVASPSRDYQGKTERGLPSGRRAR